MIGELFDPQAEMFIEDRLHPHWSQVGAIVFLTIRTRDSIPKEVIERWEREKQDWLVLRGHPADIHWSELVPTLQDDERLAFKKVFNRARESFLDTCHGACVMRQSALSMIVADSFVHFDGDRYCMGDFIVMPNHAHLLVAFATPDALKTQCDSWMHYTGWQINLALEQSGKFWQQEPFDHLVRSPEQYEYLRHYIADNPKKANLQPGEYHYRRYAK
jgi:putative transposase